MIDIPLPHDEMMVLISHRDSACKQYNNRAEHPTVAGIHVRLNRIASGDGADDVKQQGCLPEQKFAYLDAALGLVRAASSSRSSSGGRSSRDTMANTPIRAVARREAGGSNRRCYSQFEQARTTAALTTDDIDTNSAV